ncbi:MAG TPA: fibronectin type III domain-containing protein [Methanomassiliicoccales archaeon]|jgi:archaellin/fibronectin type 3 domain-containing protein
MKRNNLIVVAVVAVVAVLILVSTLAVSMAPKTPTAPQHIQAISGNTQSRLNWQAPTDNGNSAITGYKLYRSTTSDGIYTQIASPSGLTYTDTGLTNGQSYWYYVSAVNSAGEGIKTDMVLTVPFTVPKAPTGLMATAGIAQVSLNWTAPSSDGGNIIDYYVIYQDGSVLTEKQTGLTATIDGLTDGSSHTFTVAAHNLAGEGYLSNSVVSTPATVPNAPTGLTATAGNGDVTLNWTAPKFNGGSSITDYKVYRSTTSGEGMLLATLDSSLITFTGTSLKNGSVYYYTVSALNIVGEGARSNVIVVTPGLTPTAPIGLTAFASNAQVNLNWTAPWFNGGSIITGYNLYRSTTSGGVYALIASLSGLAYVDTGLTSGRSYWYKVCAENAIGEGASAGPKGVQIPSVAPGFVVQDVMGTVDTDTHAYEIITDLTIQIRLQAGSPSVNMDLVSIQYVSGNTNKVLTFVQGTNNAVANVSYGANSTGMAATWISGNHVVQQGDLITVGITGLTLGYTAAATVKIVPANGSSTLISFVTPSYYSTAYVNLK